MTALPYHTRVRINDKWIPVAAINYDRGIRYESKGLGNEPNASILIEQRKMPTLTCAMDFQDVFELTGACDPNTFQVLARFPPETVNRKAQWFSRLTKCDEEVVLVSREVVMPQAKVETHPEGFIFVGTAFERVSINE